MARQHEDFNLGGFYPGGASNPHVEVYRFDGGWWIEPVRDETREAISFQPEMLQIPLDDRLGILAGRAIYHS